MGETNHEASVTPKQLTMKAKKKTRGTNVESDLPDGAKVLSLVSNMLKTAAHLKTAEIALFKNGTQMNQRAKMPMVRL